MSVATVTETARVEELRQGEHEYDRHWEPIAAIPAPRQEPNVLLSAWLHDTTPPTGTYRLTTSWGARSDEVQYREKVA